MQRGAFTNIAYTVCFTALLTSVAAAQVTWRSGPMTAPTQSRAAAVSTLTARGPARHFVVQFAGPVAPPDRVRLEAAGLTLQTYLGDHAWFARTADTGVRGAELADFVALSGAWTIAPHWKLHPSFADGNAPAALLTPQNPGATERQRLLVYVLFHPGVTPTAARQVIEQLDGLVSSEFRTLNGLSATLPPENIAALAADDAVMYIEPALPALEPILDSVRVRTGADVVQAPPYNLDGSGVTVMVLDGGAVSTTHADLVGRVTVMDGAEIGSHATHVGGIVAGDGTASTVSDPNATPYQYRGMAPAATLLSYSIGGSAGPPPPQGLLFINEPRTLEDDIADAMAHGAVINNASLALTVSSSTSIISCDVLGDYTVVSGIIDSIVRGAFGQPFRSVWGVGNERGLSACGGDAYATVSPPHAAKNHITVGAVNSNDDSMTNFSSWGPTDDGRIKPDFVAPGCRTAGFGGIVSAWAYDNWDYYVLCGTSMASPAVTGLSALLIQDYRAHYPDRALFRNSTLKALFAHTAVDLGNAGPDYKFGYGSVRIQPAIDLLRAGGFWEGNLEQGQAHTRSVTVTPDSPTLKVTIAWDDYPATPNVASALINDLDLVVTSPTGVRHYPWTLNPASPALPAVQTAADHRNNIEQVYVANPEPGDWTIAVVATDVPMGPQPFSIVGAGAAQAGLTVDFPAGLLTSLPPQIASTLVAKVTAQGETLVPGSAQLFYRYDGGAFQSVPFAPAGGEYYAATLPPPACGDVAEYYVHVEGTLSGVVQFPAAAPATVYTAAVGSIVTTFYDDFETDQGWTTGTNGATAGFWERGVPVPPIGVFDFGPAADGDGSGRCYLTDNRSGLTDVDNGGGSSPRLCSISPAARGSWTSGCTCITTATPVTTISALKSAPTALRDRGAGSIAITFRRARSGSARSCAGVSSAARV